MRHDLLPVNGEVIRFIPRSGLSERECPESEEKKLRFITQHQFDEKICRKLMCALMGLRSISICTVNVNITYIVSSHPDKAWTLPVQ